MSEMIILIDYLNETNIFNKIDQCQSMIIRFKDRDNNRRILIKCEMGQV